MSKKVLAIIPARLASTRLPRKVLLDRSGKPLIRHVYESVARAGGLDKVVVATDSDEVVEACRSFGAEAVLTSPECQSGTDRVAEAARRFPDFEVVLNVQGDEPEMDAGLLTALVAAFRTSDCEMGTVASPWPSGVELENPSNVKVVVNRRKEALYFSRSVIPHVRDEASLSNALKAAGLQAKHQLYRKHVGVYAFRADVLQQYAGWPAGPLELAENLEQLRALDHGIRILVVDYPYLGLEVNTPEEYEAFVQRTLSANSANQ